MYADKNNTFIPAGSTPCQDKQHDYEVLDSGPPPQHRCRRCGTIAFERTGFAPNQYVQMVPTGVSARMVKPENILILTHPAGDHMAMRKAEDTAANINLQTGLHVVVIPDNFSLGTIPRASLENFHAKVGDLLKEDRQRNGEAGDVYLDLPGRNDCANSGRVTLSCSKKKIWVSISGGKVVAASNEALVGRWAYPARGNVESIYRFTTYKDPTQAGYAPIADHAAAGKIKEITEGTVERILKIRNSHLEQLATAFCEATKLDPRNAVLHERTEANGVTCWWFEPREVSTEGQLQDAADAPDVIVPPKGLDTNG